MRRAGYCDTAGYGARARASDPERPPVTHSQGGAYQLCGTAESHGRTNDAVFQGGAHCLRIYLKKVGGLARPCSARIMWAVRKPIKQSSTRTCSATSPNMHGDLFGLARGSK